jgi:hypothetical protein
MINAGLWHVSLEHNGMNLSIDHGLVNGAPTNGAPTNGAPTNGAPTKNRTGGAMTLSMAGFLETMG